MLRAIHKILFLILLFGSVIVQASVKTLYMMLNVDQTILDRTIDCDNNTMDYWRNNGFHIQKLIFMATKQSSPKFINIYNDVANGAPVQGQSKFMGKIKVKKIEEDYFQVEECIIIRPSLSYLIEHLIGMEIPVKILLTSRNDDARTNNLQKNLLLKIKNYNFQDLTYFISRDWFRIKTKINGKDISVKSAKLLREKYPVIKENDYVVILDHISSDRFIKGHEFNDLHVAISKFNVSNNYDYAQDQNEIKEVIKKIKNHVGSKNK